MTTVEEPVAYVNDTDEPAPGHMPKGKLFPGQDMFTAICGARLIGIEMPPEHPRCPICEDAVEKFLFGIY